MRNNNAMQTHDHDNTPQKLLERMRGISLPSERRERMRQTLASYADFHPVETNAPRARVFSWFHLSVMRRHVLALPLLAVAGGLTGGVSYAAESAIPGAILYPIKIQVNERVVGLLSRSDEEAAKWQARIMLRRIDEAEQLAVSNSLDAATEASLRAQIAASIENAVLGAQTLDKKGQRGTAANVRAGMEASLRAHVDILAALGTRSVGADANEKTTVKKKEDEVLDSFIASLRAQRQSVAEARKEARGAETDMAADARAYLAAAEESVEEARDAVGRNDEDAQANLAAQAKARLDIAEKRLHTARTAFAGEQYAQAGRDAEKAAFAAKEAIIFTASAQMISISAELDFSSMAATDEDETEREVEPAQVAGQEESQKQKKDDAQKSSGGHTDIDVESAADVGL